MSQVAVLTDSAASIPLALMESLRIRWVPYYIHRGKEVLRDLLTIQPESFYHWLPSAKELPTTASPGPGDYLKRYQALAEEGFHDVVSIHMTSKGSGAYQAALAAREMLLERWPQMRIEVIDTLNTAMAHGWMAVEAARAALAGRGLAEVVAVVRRLIPITRMALTADTLKYLYMGGRIGRAKHMVGSLLNLKPIIGMEEGVIVPLGAARGRSAAFRKIVDLLERSAGRLGKVKVAYVHAAALKDAERLKALVEARLQVVESLISELSPALGVHSGPGAVGVCFYPIGEGD